MLAQQVSQSSDESASRKSIVSLPPHKPSSPDGPYGTYKNYARHANRTLTTFTNEMSQILRQSIERLDTISMRVRGCVLDMEQQRVAMDSLQINPKDLQTWQHHDISKPIDIIQEEDSSVNNEDGVDRLPEAEHGTSQKGPPSEKVEACERPDEKPKKLSKKVSVSRSTTAKKICRTDDEVVINSNEKEVMNKIQRQHHRQKAQAKTGEGDAAVVEKVRSKHELRAKRRGRERPMLVSPGSAKEGKHSKMSTSTTIPKPMEPTSKNSKEVLSNVTEPRNTNLVRKYANSNFQDQIGTQRSHTKVENMTVGGQLVRMTSDVPQDWSVIMHTQKSPTRYELKQNALLPANNILDDITLKDLEPLKAEYPRKDHLHVSQRVEDTLLYRLVHDEVSLGCLIDVNYPDPSPLPSVSKSRVIAKTMEKKKMKAPVSPPPANSSPKTNKAPRKGGQKKGKTRARPDLQPDMSRAGVYRSKERGDNVNRNQKRPVERKKRIANETKRIAVRLSQIKANYPSPLQSTSSSPQHREIYRQAPQKEAKRMLKECIVDPGKIQRQYMVLMMHGVDYHRSTHPWIVSLLAPYIYLNPEHMDIVHPQEYTIAMMSSSSHQPQPQPRFMHTKRIRSNREPEPKVVQGKPKRIVSTGTSKPPTKHITPSTMVSSPSSRNNSQLDPVQVRAIISNMETQLTYVMNSQSIDDKANVIRGLQKEMEWILKNLEGNSLSKTQKCSDILKTGRKSGESLKTREPQSTSTTKVSDSNKTNECSKHISNTSTMNDVRDEVLCKWRLLENPSLESTDHSFVDVSEELDVAAIKEPCPSKWPQSDESMKLEWSSEDCCSVRAAATSNLNLHARSAPEQLSFPETPKCQLTESLSQEDMGTMQQNIKYLEKQLGVETQLFAEEMEEAITKIGAQASKMLKGEEQKSPSGGDHLLGSLSEAVTLYRNEMQPNEKSQGVQAQPVAQVLPKRRMRSHLAFRKEDLKPKAESKTTSGSSSRNNRLGTKFAFTVRRDVNTNMTDGKLRPGPVTTDEYIKSISTPLMQDIREELLQRTKLAESKRLAKENSNPQQNPICIATENGSQNDLFDESIKEVDEFVSATEMNIDQIDNVMSNEEESNNVIVDIIKPVVEECIDKVVRKQCGIAVEPRKQEIEIKPPRAIVRKRMSTNTKPKQGWQDKGRDGSISLVGIYTILFATLIWSLNWRYTCLPSL